MVYCFLKYSLCYLHFFYQCLYAMLQIFEGNVFVCTAQALQYAYKYVMCSSIEVSTRPRVTAI